MEVYSGDVLNTTTRIQEKCNEFKVDFLISQETTDLIHQPVSAVFKHIGEVQERGKTKTLSISSNCKPFFRWNYTGLLCLTNKITIFNSKHAVGTSILIMFLKI